MRAADQPSPEYLPCRECAQEFLAFSLVDGVCYECMGVATWKRREGGFGA